MSGSMGVHDASRPLLHTYMQRKPHLLVNWTCSKYMCVIALTEVFVSHIRSSHSRTTMALSLQRSACPVRASSRVPACSRAARLVVRCNQQQEEKTVNGGHALVAATLTAGMLMGAQLAVPQEALAARSGGRAGASSFSARRAAP